MLGPVVLLVLLTAWMPQGVARADQPPDVPFLIVGRVANAQGLAVSGADVRLFVAERQRELLNTQGQPCKEVETLEDGSFILTVLLSAEEARALAQGQQAATVEVSAPAYRTTRLAVDERMVASASQHYQAAVGEIALPRIFNAAFFVAVLAFAIVFLMISLRWMHETMAALAGAVFVLAVTYVFGVRWPALYIIDFERAMRYVDFDVIFLVLALTIFVGIAGRTGVFQWTAFAAFRLARGRAWPLAILLVLITAVASAFLNNVTIMLLIAPVSIQIALALEINPLAFLIPEVLASNIGGAATLIGDPPNTLIGSYADLGFGPFLTNLGPVVVVLTIVFVGMTWFLYGRGYRQAREKISPALLERLTERAQVRDPVLLRKVGVAALVTLVLFFVGDVFHMPPAVAALIGATFLMVWARPSVSEMIAEVDWTTLVFFIALFILVGALQEVGLIQLIAEAIARVAGESLPLAIILLVWVPALGSAIVANIPFALAMLPVAAYLTQTVPGADSHVLYWALALGTCLGGNATVIGAAANIVTAGVAERAGYPVSFKNFARVGVPVTFVTLAISTLYLLIRY
jgi:Na+/H+ antiporter NhaD/arsenite permease-like protein